MEAGRWKSTHADAIWGRGAGGSRGDGEGSKGSRTRPVTRKGLLSAKKSAAGHNRWQGTRTIAEHSIDSADAGRMCLIECSIREVGTK